MSGPELDLGVALAVERIARFAHEINRAYCGATGDASQPAWSDAPEWQRDSARAGVVRALTDPGVTPEAMHAAWSDQKLRDGWRYGEVKDPEAKTHPCLVPYQELPLTQRVKDHLFLAVVRCFDLEVPAAAPAPELEEPPAEGGVPDRFRTEDDALIYVNHLVREFLLEQLAGLPAPRKTPAHDGWRGMRERAETDADRHELGLVINVAERLALSLRIANRKLAQDEVTTGPVIVRPGGRA